MTSFSVFGLPHLSEDAVAAYADGVLSPAAMIRAEKHCLECVECARAVSIQREAASMLQTAPPPSLPSGLMDRLSALPGSTSMPPPLGGLPTAIGADGIPVFVTHRKPTDGTAHRNRLRVAVPVGVLASAAAVMAVSTVGNTLTSPDRRGPSNAPALIVPIVQASQATSTTPAPLPSSTSSSPSGGAPFSVVSIGGSTTSP